MNPIARVLTLPFGGTGGNSTCTSIAQDGAAPGSLSWFDVDNRGVVHGSFSNGREEESGRLAVALVARPEQLQPVCDRLYVTTAWSGELVPGQAVEGGRAAITQGMLEDLPADPTSCSPP
jgi:flagellar hook protein FlgE